MLLIGFEKEFRLALRRDRIAFWVGIGRKHAIHRSRAARRDVEPSGRVKSHIPDVVRLRIRLSILGLLTGLFVGSLRAVELCSVEDQRGAAVILLDRRIGV